MATQLTLPILSRGTSSSFVVTGETTAIQFPESISDNSFTRSDNNLVMHNAAGGEITLVDFFCAW